jgi:hypothetical protein
MADDAGKKCQCPLLSVHCDKQTVRRERWINAVKGGELVSGNRNATDSRLIRRKHPSLPSACLPPFPLTPPHRRSGWNQEADWRRGRSLRARLLEADGAEHQEQLPSFCRSNWIRGCDDDSPGAGKGVPIYPGQADQLSELKEDDAPHGCLPPREKGGSLSFLR